MDIEGVLRRINGRGYKAYKELERTSWRIDGIDFRLVRVQGDPFAPPSIVSATTTLRGLSGLAPIPLCDLLYRRLHNLAPRYQLRRAGEGGSGVITVPRPGPVVIARSGAVCRGGRVELRARVGLPSRGRRILGDVARELLLDRLPRLVREVLSLDRGEAERHVLNWRIQEWIREALPRLGLVSFIGNGSILPRRCGGCWEPLEGAIPFESPKSLEVSIELPNGGSVTGMGVKRGLTVITGPAFHGKTTLAEAIASGVWNHIEGDGRERVVTVRNAVTLESENGRWVSCIDLSQWIHGLPGGRDTRCFSTSDASGATSIFASLQEAVEAGAELLIIDEDSTATNALHRDQWAERITGKRTITTISDSAARLKEAGISVVIVASGAIPLLSQADTIIVMDEYRPIDASWYRREAERIAREAGYRPVEEPYKRPGRRFISKPLAIDKYKVRGNILESRQLEDTVNLAALRQVEEHQQLTTASEIAVRLSRRSCIEPVREAARLAEVLSQALFREVLGDRVGPEASEVRSIDILWILNRLPGIGLSYSCRD